MLSGKEMYRVYSPVAIACVGQSLYEANRQNTHSWLKTTAVTALMKWIDVGG